MLAGRPAHTIMNLLVTSDLHLSPASTNRNAEFLKFLESALRDGDEVLIVGDLFDLWFGRQELTFHYQKELLSRIRELVRKGLVIDYVEGNRDFGIVKYEGELFRKVSRHALQRRWGDFQVYAEHGDLINQDDIPYRTWRAITRNRVSFFLLDHLPASLLLSLSARIEEKLRRTNVKYKSSYPEEMCRKFCETRFQEGADLVIVGHFHVEREVSLQAGERSVLFYNLPGWEQGLRYLVIPQQGMRPYFEDWEGKSWKYFNGAQARS
jgi:UDP-2,3-diacylglucosamine hydrolase